MRRSKHNAERSGLVGYDRTEVLKRKSIAVAGRLVVVV